MTGNRLRFLSWGAGVQSTALAVMSVLGDFGLPRVDVVFHSDLGWERARTVEVRELYAAWLQAHGVPVVVVNGGDIRHDGAKAHVHIPFWTAQGGPLKRQCSRNFKITPVRRAMREWLGLPAIGGIAPVANCIEQWIGFSFDEARRCASSDVAYIVNRFPLVELGLTRADCSLYLESKGLPVPVKSACIGCPYRSASEFLEMKVQAPGEFADACAFDAENRCNPLVSCGSTASEIFVWRGRIPLADVDLVVESRREMGRGAQLGLFSLGGRATTPPSSNTGV